MKRLHGVDNRPPIHSSVIEAQIVLSLNLLCWAIFWEEFRFIFTNNLYYEDCYLGTVCRKHYKLCYTGYSRNNSKFGGVTARAVEGIQWWECSRWLAAVLPFLDDAMSWSGEHRGFVVETFFKNNESVIATQRAFRSPDLTPCDFFSLGLPKI